MTRRGARTGHRLGSVVLVPIVVLAALAVVTRIERALRPAAASVTSDVLVTPPAAATELSDPPVTSTGFAGPDRLEDAPVPGAQESRTWHAAGRWWAVLNRAADGALTIWGLQTATGPWVDTGVLVDSRSFARPEVAWNGSELVVATSGTRPYASHALQTNRFRWDPQGDRWRQEADFPVTVVPEPMPDTRLVVLPDGTEWMAHLQDGAISVARSDGSGLEHEPFAPLAEGMGDRDVGGFDLTIAQETVQLAWRSLTTDVLHVSRWTGTAWEEREFDVYGTSGAGAVAIAPAGPKRPGALLVVTNTTLGDRGSNDRDPEVLLSVIEGDEIHTSVVSRLQDGLSDPTLAVDGDAGVVHVVAQGPSAELRPTDLRESASVVEKTADVTDPTFAPGPGRTLLFGDVGTELAPPVVPAGSVAGLRGLLVMVTGGDLSGWRSALTGGQVADGASLGPTAGPVVVIRDTFDGLAGGGPAPSAWHASGEEPLEATVVDAAGGGRGLLVTNEDGGSAPQACRAVPANAGRTTIRADVIATGSAATDARLLTVRGAEGTLAAVRQSRKGETGWSGEQGRVVAGTVPLGTPLRVTVTVTADETTASIRIEAGATVVVDDPNVALRSSAAGGVDEVCVGPGSNDPAASLLVTDLVVQQG